MRDTKLDRKRGSSFAVPGEEQTERTRKVIEAAGDLFLARGFEGVSLQDIVTETGGSFRDLYRDFGSKETLFLRVVSGLCDAVIAPLEAIGGSSGVERPLEEVLTSIAGRVLEALLSPRLLGLQRLILSEAKRFPALGSRWYEVGPNTANRVLGAVLQRYSEAGLLQTEDPCLLAAIFLDSLINNLQLRRLTGMTVSKADMDERVRICVQVFLNGVRERRSSSISTERRTT